MENITAIEIDREAIGLKLAKRRTDKGLTLKEIGEAIGENRGRVWQFEQGVGLTIENIAKLAKYYGETIDEFIKGG
ncbi:MAG: helix-turn-helix domain-containing protein, partial [Aridibacter sp.]